MPTDLVTYQVADHIATITMNDPATLNAISTPMKNALMAALIEADSDDDVRVIVLQGSNQNFSSGGHIGEMLENGTKTEALAEKIEAMVSGVAELSLKLRTVYKPIIAKLEGAVAGAGMNLALTCDFRIASDNAKFVQAFVNIGLIPDAGGIYLLTQLIGAAKTTELVMLGDKLTAEDMKRLDLVNEVTSAAHIDDCTQQLAKRLSQLPSKALATMKDMVNTHAFMGLNEALDMEVHQQTMMAQTAEFKEGISAFMEKRAPNYQNK